MRRPASQKIAVARRAFEIATGRLSMYVQRNEFIGPPVTSTERKLRQFRDWAIRKELRLARRALRTIEEAINA